MEDWIPHWITIVVTSDVKREDETKRIWRVLLCGSTPRRCFGKPGLISRCIVMEAVSGCVGCARGGKPRREFHHVCHTFQSAGVCKQRICVAPWCVQSLPSRGRDIQSVIVRNVEGGRGRGIGSFVGRQKMKVTVTDSGQPSDGFPSAQGKRLQEWVTV